MKPSPQAEQARVLAHFLQERGLHLPALLLLESHRPLAGLLGHALLLWEPVCRPLGLGSLARSLAELLQDGEGVEALLAELESAR